MIDTKKEQERDELHRAIWAIADDLRGAVDGWDFKNYVLGTMFYRYISENLCNYINSGEHAAGNMDFDFAAMPDSQAEEARDGLVEEKGFFILPSELFCNVRAKAVNDENLNETLERVFNHIENSAKGSNAESDFAGLFDDFDVNSNKLGSTVAKRNEKLVKLLNGVGDMSLKISQSEKMKSEFISSVSHELRTPLTAINGWGETILADTTGDPIQMRRGIRIILKESRRLTTMVEELLEFSKMEDGRFTLRMEQVDLQAEFEDAIFTYRELFRQEGITLEYDAGEQELPPVFGDPERLKQVFCNVLDNAAKHGGSGKRIAASIVLEGAAEVIRIRDFGPGIPQEELPFVKQKFYKGSSKARGSGIGLAVCDEIISLHGGKFEIANAADGGGVLVTIRLPLKESV